MSGIKGMKKTKIPHVSEETRAKISETMKAKWRDKKYREQMSNAHKHPLPEEWKENIAFGMIGMKRSDKTKKKMSAYQSNRTFEHELKCRKAWKEQWNGLSKDEQLKRLSKWIEAGHNATQNMFLTPSSIENKVAHQLDELNIRYIQQKKVNNGFRNFYLDFYIPSLKLVIECNGDYWHNFPDRKARDKNLKKYVESTGRKIIFIWEHEINDDWFWIGDYL